MPCASEAIDRNSLTANFCIFYANSGKKGVTAPLIFGAMSIEAEFENFHNLAS